MTDEKKLVFASFGANLGMYQGNPWSPEDIDKLEIMDDDKFYKLVDSCRFFYRHDPITSTVINKMVDIGITDIVFKKSDLSANEYRIISALKDEFEEFAEAMALEYLISGLVVPEIKYAPATREQLREFGIKKYETLTLPVSMWLRDPKTIKINSVIFSEEPSYFVTIPDELVYFITSGGQYRDGTKDIDLYNKLKTYYPAFVVAVAKGEKYIKIDNPYILRRRVLTDTPYPTPYLFSVLEALKHKRNLRRMDYSIASRVIGAIQLFRLGSDQFPVTEDQQEQFDAVRDQMYWRNSSGRDVERIFQLFANHTLDITWVYPPMDALLNEKKYFEVNMDIIFGLGFPQILMTGETQRTGTSNPEFAMMSPMETMDNFRNKILDVLNKIVDKVLLDNNLKGDTEVKFKPINLKAFTDFVTGISKLYDSGNLSRKSYTETFGFDYDDEVEQRVEEKADIKKLGLDEFSPQPFSPKPGNQQMDNQQQKVDPQQDKTKKDNNNQQNPQK